MRLDGLHVPLVTPLRRDGALDLDAVAPHLERMLDGGVDGVVALGTTGEFADLASGERGDVVRTTVAAASGRVPVFAGVGAVGTTEACRLAQDSADAGAAGVLSLPPLYWKLDLNGLRRHYEAVLAASDLPVVLYDFPSLAGTELPVALIAELASHPRVLGVKLSGPELRKVHAVLERTAGRDDFAVLVGAADLVLPAMLAGAHGAIVALANIAPALLVRLARAAAEGPLEEARALHGAVLRLLAVPGLASPPILALKAAAAVHGSPLAAAVRTEPDDAPAVVERAQALARELRG